MHCIFIIYQKTIQVTKKGLLSSEATLLGWVCPGCSRLPPGVFVMMVMMVEVVVMLEVVLVVLVVMNIVIVVSRHGEPLPNQSSATPSGPARTLFGDPAVQNCPTLRSALSLKSQWSLITAEWSMVNRWTTILLTTTLWWTSFHQFDFWHLWDISTWVSNSILPLRPTNSTIWRRKTEPSEFEWFPGSKASSMG